MVVIGITGTLGAGKGTIVEFLVHEKNFKHYSVRAYLIREIERRGIAVNRDSMTTIANELRANHSPSFITDALYQEAVEAGTDCIIESIRTPGEIVSLREKGNFYLFAVDAEPRLRYERIKLRASETDLITFETFLSNEAREMNSSDPNKQNLAACIQQADIVLHNNGSVNMLHLQIEQALKKIK